MAIVQRLRAAGHVAYFAGGCVRDYVLGLDPKDYDVATDAPPQRVRELFPDTQAVGAAFGVILVHMRPSVIEVATFRAEGPYHDGRRPSQVRFTTAQEDAHRRDFTINGLFLDPMTDMVIDYVGGQADLASRTLRAIGIPSQRFEEDHLRLLRAIRFAARFDLHIEPKTAEAILAHAPLLKRISPERIAEELRLMLTPPTRNRAWPMLWEYRLVGEIFRFLSPRENVFFNQDRSIFLQIIPSESIPFSLALAAGGLCYRCQMAGEISDSQLLLILGEARQMAKAARQALRISNEESDGMEQTLIGAAKLLENAAPTLALKKRFLARPTSKMSRQLLDAMDASGFYRSAIPALRDDLNELQKTDFAPPPLLTGDDLTTAGLSPGPIFRKILDWVYDAQLENRIQTRPEALEMAMNLAKDQK